MDDILQELRERVAKIEMVVEITRSDHEKSEASIALIVDKMNAVISRMDKYEGRFGGIFLVVGAIFAFLKIEWQKVIAFLTGGKVS